MCKARRGMIVMFSHGLCIVAASATTKKAAMNVRHGVVPYDRKRRRKLEDRERTSWKERKEDEWQTPTSLRGWLSVAKMRPVILFRLAAYVMMPRETNSETLRDLAFTFPEIPRMFRHADRYRRSRFEHCRLFSSTRCDVPSSKQSVVWWTERLRGATTNESCLYIHSCNVFRVVRAWVEPLWSSFEKLGWIVCLF